MEKPTFTDYVTLIINLFERFVQEQEVEKDWYSERYDYEHQTLIVFFIMMQYRRVTKFKAQWRWLQAHPQERQVLGFEGVPDRTTLSRRYKALYVIVQDFIAFIGQYAESLDACFESRDLCEDKSLFKAQGPVWHQSDRKQGRIPDKLTHLTSNQAGFPKLIEVETAAYSEKQALAAKETALLDLLQPNTLTGDDGYTKALRIRRWAQRGVVLLTPALRWFKGRYARAYHTYIQRPENATLLRTRQTAIEPFFDLLAQVIGATDNHKQLPIQRLVNVRTCLALGVLSIQIAMIANNIWNLPFRSISHIRVCFS